MWFFSVGCFVFNVVGFCVVVMLPWIGGSLFKVVWMAWHRAQHAAHGTLTLDAEQHTADSVVVLSK